MPHPDPNYLLWITTVACGFLGFLRFGPTDKLYPVLGCSVIFAFSLPLVLVVITVKVAEPEV
jgi:hypothetical protein